MAGRDDFSTVPGTNIAINSISIAEGMNPGDLNQAIRQLIAYLANRPEVTIVSSATPNVLAADSESVAISGTTTITSLGTGANRLRFVRFTGALTLTHNATSLILPAGGANITTAAGDTMIVQSDGSSNARVLVYQRSVNGRHIIDVQIFTASGTWTRPAGTLSAIVEVWGGGGGGGYAKPNASQSAIGGGGGAGGYSYRHITTGIGATEIVTIGAAGVGGVASTSTNATVGGASSFGAHVIANGGGAGSSSSSSATTGASASGGAGGVVTGAAGSILAGGEPGSRGIVYSGTICLSGSGGSSSVGGGGATVGAGTTGETAIGYGAGGSGGAHVNGANANGGAGSAGLVVVKSYG